MYGANGRAAGCSSLSVSLLDFESESKVKVADMIKTRRRRFGKTCPYNDFLKTCLVRAALPSDLYLVHFPLSIVETFLTSFASDMIEVSQHGTRFRRILDDTATA